jgi:hypothetical protein
VYKAIAEKYGEKCCMDWNSQDCSPDLGVSAAHKFPAPILDLRKE